MLQRALIFSSSNPICSQLSATAPPDNTVFPKRNGGWIIPFSSYQLPAFRLRNYRRTLLPPLCSASDSAANRPNMASQDEQDPRISNISSAIRVIPDFPKPGIIFQDITTLLLDTKAFRDTIDLFVERYRGKDISVVAGIEARGFIFGPPIALAIGAKFVPMRKPNKLPGEVLSEEYSLEYGKDTMEMHVDAVKVGERALIIDDLVATGGTLSAAIRLLERVGVHIVECACVIELPELKASQFTGDKMESVAAFHDGAWDSFNIMFSNEDHLDFTHQVLNQFSFPLEHDERLSFINPSTFVPNLEADMSIAGGRERLGEKPLFVLVSST